MPHPVIDPQAIENLRILNPDDGDAFLREIAEIFLADTPKRIAELDQTLATGDAVAFVRAAHSIKGSSSNLGALALRQAAEVLKDDQPANLLTMRGIAKMPPIPKFQEVYGTKAAAIAVYPMYRGLARLVDMDILDAGHSLADQMACLEANWSKYDFFFIHFKYTDRTGEDGNFDEGAANGRV